MRVGECMSRAVVMLSWMTIRPAKIEIISTGIKHRGMTLFVFEDILNP